MSAGGLGQTDYGSHPEIIGGIAREFYQRNRAHYGSVRGAAAATSSCRLPSASCNVTFNLEPHVAQGIYETMLKEAGVDVLWAAQVDSVASSAGVISSVTLVDGREVAASVWVDASYEADLLARAGVSYTVGREPAAQYNESLGGRRAGGTGNTFHVAVNPYASDGTRLPLLQSEDPGVPGDGDKRVQSYNFRLCVTKAADRVPWQRPDDYNPGQWELLRRYLRACGFGEGDDAAAGAKCQVGFPSCNTAPVPAGKYDMNNCGGLSSDFIGGSWLYPDASYSDRRTIWRAHRSYVEGLLWTMANDSGVPASVREEMARWGLCADEFAATGHFPPALYVRAARRLLGDRVFTQNTPKEGPAGNLSIGLGGYNFDSHNAQRFACKNESACYGAGPPGVGASTPYAWDEGDVEIGPGVYEIPLWVTLPRRDEATNLLVVAAPSASHVGMSTLRMEPQFMIIGHSAGVLAAMAVNDTAGSVHQVDPAALHSALLADGQLLSKSAAAVQR
eukprot:TRINITY_DN13074_c0_g1_i1.p1 TRINITY_DN13074_c0_g1~~TRINITY_DN13074_c0_g1_i1.p1  ORF type:complete len:582 (+),score=180.86 TRINITY_DN13074_c0_g1_i1:233-1747(+)